MLGTLDSGREPELWQLGTMKWWRQVMTVLVKESVSVTYAE